MMVSPERVNVAARCYLGVPFLHQGRTPSAGLDCAGLVVRVLTDLGVPHTDLVGYPRLPYRHMLENHLEQQSNLRRITELKPGSILLLRIVNHPQHLGIWTGETLVHAFSDVGRVVEHRMDAAWHRKISRIYEIA